eukprot:GHVL01015844.1.p1 GENE.GHVL01015844.1~~GHVL01015844.1.p1  ORF type:complete len:296 (+),score=41.90 GHVL01015844.1:472-1359(+)
MTKQKLVNPALAAYGCGSTQTKTSVCLPTLTKKKVDQSDVTSRDDFSRERLQEDLNHARKDHDADLNEIKKIKGKMRKLERDGERLLGVVETVLKQWKERVSSHPPHLPQKIGTLMPDDATGLSGGASTKLGLNEAIASPIDMLDTFSFPPSSSLPQAWGVDNSAFSPTKPSALPPSTLLMDKVLTQVGKVRSYAQQCTVNARDMKWMKDEIVRLNANQQAAHADVFQQSNLRSSSTKAGLYNYYVKLYRVSHFSVWLNFKILYIVTCVMLNVNILQRPCSHDCLLNVAIIILYN